MSSTTPAPLAYSGLSPVRPDDPSELGWPAMFVYELALGENHPRDVCAAYGITRETFTLLQSNPRFVAHFNRAREELQEQGMSLKTKAMLISESSLSVIYDMIHNKDVCASTKLDAIKMANQMAGVGQKGSADADVPRFSITFNMGESAPIVIEQNK